MSNNGDTSLKNTNYSLRFLSSDPNVSYSKSYDKFEGVLAKAKLRSSKSWRKIVQRFWRIKTTLQKRWKNKGSSVNTEVSRFENEANQIVVRCFFFRRVTTA